MSRRVDCDDCRMLLHEAGEYFVVTDEVWLSVMPDDRGLLCLGCFEERLGREVARHEFIDCIANLENLVDGSDLLRRRMFGTDSPPPRDDPGLVADVTRRINAIYAVGDRRAADRAEADGDFESAALWRGRAQAFEDGRFGEWLDEQNAAREAALAHELLADAARTAARGVQLALFEEAS